MIEAHLARHLLLVDAQVTAAIMIEKLLMFDLNNRNIPLCHKNKTDNIKIMIETCRSTREIT